MPCLDEAETVATCVKKAVDFLATRGIDGEVVVADNGSTDGSIELATAAGARVVPIPDKGYGNALIGGIRAARGAYVIMGDADDSYDFSSLDGFVERLRAGDELVMGNRFTGEIKPGAMPPLHKYLGNPVLSRVGKLFFKAPCGDFHCGLRGFSRDAILRLDLRTTGMEFASEVVVKAVLNDLRISEVPITLYPDGRSRPPHLRSWRDGWRHLRFLLLFSPRWLFLMPGLLLLLAGAASTTALVISPVNLGHFRFGIGWLIASAVITIVGYQAVLFACLTKVYGQAEGFLPRDPRFNRVFKYVRLETGLIAGALMIVFAIGAGAVAYFAWRDSNWGQTTLPGSIRAVVPAALLLMLGSQTILGSFFLSILGVPHIGAESMDPDAAPDAASARRLTEGDEVRREPEQPLLAEGELRP
jgi:glycosyltransferase involved in cell wall biosynthesis